jgi:site-specific recombinase XerC
MTTEYLNEKAETCTPDALSTTLATLKKLQEGLYAMNWINTDVMPADWPIDGHNPPRRPYAPIETEVISQWVATRSAEYGQALRFILSSGARINEALQLHADKVLLADGQVELLGKGGLIRKIPVLHAEVLYELYLAKRFVYLPGSGAGVGRMDWNAMPARVVTR